MGGHGERIGPGDDRPGEVRRNHGREEASSKRVRNCSYRHAQCLSRRANDFCPQTARGLEPGQGREVDSGAGPHFENREMRGAPQEPHSIRNAFMGSMPEARLAGTNPAIAAQADRTTMASTMVKGSYSLTP